MVTGGFFQAIEIGSGAAEEKVDCVGREVYAVGASKARVGCVYVRGGVEDLDNNGKGRGIAEGVLDSMSPSAGELPREC